MPASSVVTIFTLRYDFSGFSLDTDARELRRGNDAVHLSPKALDLLTALIAARPRAVPKRELYDQLWPSTFVVDANLPVLVREVRHALGDGDRKIVRTVHGTGYAFAAAVRDSGDQRAESISDGYMHLLLFDNQQVRLIEGENVVGREPNAHVFLPSASVSRRHAVINIRGAEAFVTDLKSKNGTFIDSQPVTAETALHDGGMVRFGEVITRYRCCLPDGATASF